MRPVSSSLWITVVAAFVGACSGTHETHNDKAVPAMAAPVRNLPQLNVPGLLSLSIDEMSRRVGPRLPLPAGFVDPVQAPLVQRGLALDSAILFRSRGLALIAAYNNRTRRVSDLLLLGANEAELMHRAQLQLDASAYLVLPVFQLRKPTQLLGLRVLSTSTTVSE